MRPADQASSFRWNKNLIPCRFFFFLLHLSLRRVLGSAYASGYFSTVYPVSRGSGILLLTLLSSFLFAEQIGWAGALGIALIGVGVLLIGLHDVVASWWLKERNAAAASNAAAAAAAERNGKLGGQQDSEHSITVEKNGNGHEVSVADGQRSRSASEADDDEQQQERASLVRNIRHGDSDGHAAAGNGNGSHWTAHYAKSGASSAVISSAAVAPADGSASEAPVPPVFLGVGQFSCLVSADVGVPILSLAVGMIVCAYTLVDKYAADRVPSTVLLPGIFITSSFCLTPYIVFSIWPQCVEAWRNYKLELLVISIGSPYWSVLLTTNTMAAKGNTPARWMLILSLFLCLSPLSSLGSAATISFSSPTA